MRASLRYVRGGECYRACADGHVEKLYEFDGPLVQQRGAGLTRSLYRWLLIPGEAAHQNEMMSPAVTE